MADDPSSKKAVNWVDIVKAVALPLVTLILGYVFNSSLNSRQARENNVRLYADMMGRREEADSALRKDMFKSILDTFLKRESGQPRSLSLETEVLNIELLASNFHESLDIGPLFKHLHRALGHEEGNKELLWRLEKVATEVKSRQLTVLGETGRVESGSLDLKKELWWFGKASVSPKGDQTSSGPLLCMSIRSSDGLTRHRQFRLEYLQFKRREAQLRLVVSKPLEASRCLRYPSYEEEKADTEFAAEFWAGMFAFPMIDNTHLSHSERCAVSVTRIGEEDIDVAVAYFQASRASLKNKPYYDEMLRDLLERPVNPGKER